MTSNSELLNLSNKVAIVTGAVGIGYGIAYRLAQAGAKIAVVSLHMENAITSADKLIESGFEAVPFQADVAKEEDIIKMVAEVKEKYGSIDILVNNAGIYPNKPVMEMPLEEFEKVIDTNLDSVFLCTKHVSEQMIIQERGGKIINITSIDAIHPSAIGLAHYDASKHAVWGFTKNVALELAPHKIWVNAIAPGAILTPGVEKQGDKVNLEVFAKQIPHGRIGDIDDIGKVALFLASEMSSYMTGSQIVVDGGLLLK